MLEDADVQKIVAALQGTHTDAKQDEEMIAPDMNKIGEALEILAGAISELWERVEKQEGKIEEVESCVRDELIGGLNGIVDKRKRGQFLETFKGEHPEFARFEEIVRELAGKDIYEEVGNKAYELKNSPDYNDDNFMSTLKSMAEELEGKFGKYAKPMETRAEGKPVAKMVQMEVKKGVDPELQDYLKRQKSKIGG